MKISLLGSIVGRNNCTYL